MSNVQGRKNMKYKIKSVISHLCGALWVLRTCRAEWQARQTVLKPCGKGCGHRGRSYSRQLNLNKTSLKSTSDQIYHNTMRNTMRNLCERRPSAGWRLTGGVSGEADFLALFEGPSRDSVQVTIAYTTARLKEENNHVRHAPQRQQQSESERVSHTPALSTPGTVGRLWPTSLQLSVSVL